ncbi:UDP-N-acetylglucosamine--N-acetylmuramyl-(pentapeptide) pyrophosphoryl-undecaprenol N-acetylglucosamine transferase [Candidatus Uhrbacteria bacterium]|nr:UDP-N-acetylglucosamine--N-acetylmuramyl-(pentapeptide) pyrophosphoryl-undecaprenol N-acetylglucosamine transferase [Candidatus Uhrbacteria bacterium]
MKILLSGGGTLGPVTPLLGLAEYWRGRNDNVDLVWAGTTKGPEGPLIVANDIRFISIASVKIPRYATPYWIVMPFLGLYAFIESWNLLRVERPDVIVTAGGYVSVPLVVLGRVMGIPSWVHQQDVLPGLANKIMSKFARRVSVTFDSSKDLFPSSKTEVTGNAVRACVAAGDRDSGFRKFNLSPDRKTILVLGGGGGSSWINESVSALAGNLTENWQVLHITGSDKYESVEVENPHYTVEPVIHDGMDDAYAIADVVICRAGLGTMTELALVGKPAIVIPMPDSHQEMNAFQLFEHQAAIVVDQTETTPQILFNTIKHIMDDENSQMRLVANLKLTFPKDGTKKIADGVLSLGNALANSWKRDSKKKKVVGEGRGSLKDHVDQMFGEDHGAEELEDADTGVAAGEHGSYSTDKTYEQEVSLEVPVEDDEPVGAVGMSIKEQVARALKGKTITIEEGDEESPFEVKDL